jgi:hypothetical protein
LSTRSTVAVDTPAMRATSTTRARAPAAGASAAGGAITEPTRTRAGAAGFDCTARCFGTDCRGTARGSERTLALALLAVLLPGLPAAFPADLFMHQKPSLQLFDMACTLAYLRRPRDDRYINLHHAAQQMLVQSIKPHKPYRPANQ